MKILITSLTLVFFAFAEAVTAQEFQGSATYKSRQAFDFKMTSTNGMTDAMQQQMQEQLKKQFEKTHTLNFNRTESVYTENEKLAPPAAPSGGIQIRTTSSQDILYKNTSEKRYVRQQDVLGKMFLIKDSLQMPEWKMQKESKNIGQYTCYKAIWGKEKKQTTLSDNGSIKDTIIVREVVAWYTPQIPLSNGPGEFWGLPGLILEIQDGKLSILCNEIVLNPAEPVAIEEPKRGKVVDEQTYETIQKEKMEEWMERNSTRDGKGGTNITIKIGG